MNNGYKEGPFSQDTIEEKKLSEKDFIYEGPSPKSFPPWLWLFLTAVLASIIWGSAGWYEHFLSKKISNSPFLEVTNREFSVFLWQFPSFLRSNVKQKTGYLTGFQYGDQETLNLELAEEFVVAPPDLLFLYHTWSRLLSSDYIVRKISGKEFLEFLDQVKEWQPQYWKSAPEDYVNWISTIQPGQTDLQYLPESIFPIVVRQAFQGWKNYFKEGPSINQLQPTFAQVKEFINKYPNYARNYWRNIQEVAGQQVAGKNYLDSFLSETIHPDEKIPTNQLSSFLRVALFNAEQAQIEEGLKENLAQ